MAGRAARRADHPALTSTRIRTTSSGAQSSNALRVALLRRSQNANGLLSKLPGRWGGSSVCPWGLRRPSRCAIGSRRPLTSWVHSATGGRMRAMFSPPHVGEREPSEPPSHSRVLRVQERYSLRAFAEGGLGDRAQLARAPARHRDRALIAVAHEALAGSG